MEMPVMCSLLSARVLLELEKKRLELLGPGVVLL